MANIILRVIHENNSYEMGKWLSTTWTLRDDFTMIVNIRYMMNDEKDQDLNINIAQDKYEQILELLDKARSNAPQATAKDGESWEICQYEDGLKKFNLRGDIGWSDELQLLSKLLYSIIKRYTNL